MSDVQSKRVFIAFSFQLPGFTYSFQNLFKIVQSGHTTIVQESVSIHFQYTYLPYNKETSTTWDLDS